MEPDSNGKINHQAGRQSVAFWLGMFVLITGAMGALQSALNVYIIAPAIYNQSRRALMEEVDDRFVQRDRERKLQMEMIDGSLETLRQEVRALREEIRK